MSILSLALAALVVGQAPDEGEWVSLFNGKDLDGWTPKITGYESGENYGDTFRVEDGLLKVRYDNYDDFGGRFGHLFYKDKVSHYRLRIEYRFVDEQCPGGPGWAIRNSGIMFHAQSPQSMRKAQEFPVSIEAQMLGGNGKDPRHTANICTPGTHIVMDGKLITRPCTDSNSPTFAGDQWVTMELEVDGGDVIRHLVNGEVVLEYEKPQLDPGDADARALLGDRDPLLTEGYFAIQSESHPLDVRKVELMKLD